MTARIAVSTAVVLAALTVTVVALAERGSLGQAQQATAAFKSLGKATAAGYTLRLPDKTGATCIAQPPQGAMGVHMVNEKLLDGTIDAAKPEAMVYEPRANGKLGLVAVEYVVFKSAWKGSSPPSLFGRQFAFTPEGNRYGLPPFYALHAWIYKKNPSGLLSAWNPRVTCK